MPFTPTHILAVVPIYFFIRKLPLTALAIGSMVPDIPFFYPIVSYSLSHSAVGLIVFCLPVGLIMYFLFEGIGKFFLIDISPLWIRSRLSTYREIKIDYGVIHLFLLLIAIVLGSVTHVVWDAFTHENSWGVQLFPWLSQSKSVVGNVIPRYKLVQYGSTIVGLPILLFIAIFQLKRHNPVCALRGYRFPAFVSFTISTSFICIPIVVFLYHWNSVHSLSMYVGIVIKQSIGIGLVLFLLYSLVYRILKLNLSDT